MKEARLSASQRRSRAAARISTLPSQPVTCGENGNFNLLLYSPGGKKAAGIKEKTGDACPKKNKQISPTFVYR